MPAAVHVRFAVPLRSVCELPIETFEPLKSKKNSTVTPPRKLESAKSVTTADNSTSLLVRVFSSLVAPKSTTYSDSIPTNTDGVGSAESDSVAGSNIGSSEA